MPQGTAPVANTGAGTYQGLQLAGGVCRFRGIRYAAAPVGPLRWAPPQPPPPFAGVRQALEPGPACPQRPDWDGPYRAAARMAGVDESRVAMAAGVTDEDCLCLDLWTPSFDNQREKLAPVLVWIHGGASVYGSGSAALFDGARLAAEQGVVVVNITHRLGVFGFLAHPELVAESQAWGKPTAGNYGFLDQVAALEWVRDNIASFGGDPECVTVMGESAGGRAVFELLAHRPARGLFHRAIAQSPWEEKQHRRRLDQPCGELVSALELGQKLVERLDVDRKGALARLRELPSETILAAAEQLGFPPATWGPIVDGTVFPAHPLTLMARGQSHAVPLLLGCNAHEGTIFFLGELPFPTGRAYEDYVRQAHPAEAEELLALYPPSDDRVKLHRSFSALYGDRTFTFPALLAAKALSPSSPVYLYRFTHVHPPFGVGDRTVGAFHASEIPFVFGNFAGGPFDSHDEPLGQAIRSYWVEFARSGDPNNDSGAPEWPRFAPEEQAYLELGDEIVEYNRPLPEQYAVWSRALAANLDL